MAEFAPDKHCGAQRANQPPGVLCTRPKGWGTSHPGVGRCKRHGGSTPPHERAASRELAERECLKLGVPIVVDPGEALLQSLFEREGNVAFYRTLVQELEPVEGSLYGAMVYETGEAKPHVLVELYHRELAARDAVAVSLLKAGVEERRVRLAEGEAQRMAAFGRALAAQLNLDPASAQMRSAFRAALEEIAGSAREAA